MRPAAVAPNLWVRVTSTTGGKLHPVKLLGETNPFELSSIDVEGNLWAELTVNLLLDHVGDNPLSFDLSHSKCAGSSSSSSSSTSRAEG